MKLIYIINHFKTITKHKKYVMEYCFRAGLYRQGLLHDMSKYSPVEFVQGCRYYQGVRSPNNEERERTGVSRAWLHHKGRNKHHMEYWTDYSPDPAKRGEVVGCYMPVRYVVEMFCDRVAASRVYQGENYTDASALNYYNSGPAKEMLHPDSRKVLETLLKLCAERGEDAAFAYIRNILMPTAKKMDRKPHLLYTPPEKRESVPEKEAAADGKRRKQAGTGIRGRGTKSTGMKQKRKVQRETVPGER